MTPATNEAERIVLGKRVVLGTVIAEFVFPNEAVLTMKRMGMSKEELFTDLYKAFVTKIDSLKGGVMDRIGELLTPGAGKVSFGLFEVLSLVGDVLGRVPEFHDVLLDSLMVILQANNAPESLTREYLHENLSTVDCFTIIKTAAEVQGLLASFRGLLGGLGSIG